MTFEILKIPELIEVCRVKTPEEAHHMLKKWIDYKPDYDFQIMEVH